jgi:outer membrane autotransporter protein
LAKKPDALLRVKGSLWGSNPRPVRFRRHDLRWKVARDWLLRLDMSAPKRDKPARMKPTSPKPARGVWLAVPLAATLAALSLDCAAETIFGNLDRPADGLEKFTRTRWLGSMFSTDGRTYLLTDITLRLQRNIPGIVSVAVFSDAGGRPGKMIGMLDAKGQITGVVGDVLFQTRAGTTSFETTVSEVSLSGVFSAPKGVKISGVPGGEFTASGSQPSGLTLAPDSNYWVVMKTEAGEYASAYTDSETGDGVGYSPVWAVSGNAGGSWQSRSTSPLFLEVLGDPTRVIIELRTDEEAIQSAVFSGLPMALAQREILFSAVAETTRDVNARLYRQRIGADVQRGWEFFTGGRYGANDTDSMFNTVGFQSDIWSGTVGAEYHFDQRFTLGAAFTHLTSDHSLGSGVGDVELDGVALTAYAAFAAAGFYADVLYSFGSFEHGIRRDTLFGDTALAEPDSETHTLELNVGYNLETAGFVTGPFGSLTYVTGDLDGYTEHGAGTKNVHVEQQDFESLVMRIGWQGSREISIGSVKVIPQLRMAWRHEFMDESEAVDTGLEQSPFQIGNGRRFERVGRFDVASNTEQPTADALEIGFAVGIVISERMLLVLDYETRLFQGDSAGHAVSLTGRIKF